jgi:hypothetical protein
MKARVLLCIAPFLGISLTIISVSPGADAQSDDMPIVGLDRNLHSYSRWIPGMHYLTRFKSVTGAVQQSLAPVFQEAESRPVSAHSAWKLRTIAVGTSCGLEAGLGANSHISAEARFRLVYTNSLNPVFPD